MALRYCEQALSIEITLLEDSKINRTQVASTRLNLCAILSILGRHNEAQLQAEEAIESLMKELKEVKGSKERK